MILMINIGFQSPDMRVNLFIVFRQLGFDRKINSNFVRFQRTLYLLYPLFRMRNNTAISITTKFVGHSWFINAYNAFANIKICLIFDGVWCSIVMIMTTPVALRETVEVLQTQVQIEFVGDERAHRDQRARHFVEFQPCVQFVLSVNGRFREVPHHVLMGFAIFDEENTAKTYGLFEGASYYRIDPFLFPLYQSTHQLPDPYSFWPESHEYW